MPNLEEIKVVIQLVVAVTAVTVAMGSAWYLVGRQLGRISAGTSALSNTLLKEYRPISERIAALEQQIGTLRGQIYGIRHEISTLRSCFRIRFCAGGPNYFTPGE